MATIRHMEDALDAVYDYFNSNLDAKIDAIEIARSVTIPAIGHIKARESRKQLFPRIEIIADRTVNNYGNESMPLTDPWKYHSITIFVSHKDADTENLTNVLMRYVEAIEDVTQDDDTYDSKFVWVRLGDADYGPMLEDQQDRKVLQGVTVELECRTR